MQILLVGVFMALCTGHCLAVLNSAQSSSSFGDSKDKAAAADYQYNEPAQQYQPVADTQLGYHYQAPFKQQQQQQQQQHPAAGYQYKAPAQQYSTAAASQTGTKDIQSGYHYQASSPQQQQHQQQPAVIGSSFYQHSSLGPALALDVDNALPAKLPAQAGHYFVHHQQPDATTQTAGYNYFAPSPNHFATSQQQPPHDTLPHTAAASSILANSNSVLSNPNPNAASEHQNYLLQKLAQLNLLSGTKAGAFSAGQGQTNNLITASQAPQQVFNAQVTPTNGQQDSPAFDSFRQPNQDYAYTRPAPTASPVYHTNNKQQGAYFGATAAPTILNNFEYNKQQAAFDEVQQSSAQTAQLDNNEKYTQTSFAGNHPLIQSDRYNNQQAQLQLPLGSQSNGYNYAAQGNNGFNAATQATVQAQDYAFPAGNGALPSSLIAGSQNALSPNAAGHKTSSYYQGSLNSQQQASLTSNSALLSGEQFLREEQQAQQQQHTQQQQYQQQHQLQQYQQHSQLSSLELPSLGLPATAYVYQKTQSQSYELPTIVQQPAQLQSQTPLHQALRRPHVLYGTPSA